MTLDITFFIGTNSSITRKFGIVSMNDFEHHFFLGTDISIKKNVLSLFEGLDAIVYFVNNIEYLLFYYLCLHLLAN